MAMKTRRYPVGTFRLCRACGNLTPLHTPCRCRVLRAQKPERLLTLLSRRVIGLSVSMGLLGAFIVVWLYGR